MPQIKSGDFYLDELEIRVIVDGSRHYDCHENDKEI